MVRATNNVLPLAPLVTLPYESALVTGGADGIGLAIVARLLERPAIQRVIATTRDAGEARTLIELAAADPRLHILELDLTDTAQLDTAVDAIAELGSLDLVVNTAGVLHDGESLFPERRLSAASADNLLRTFQVNAVGALMLAQAVEPLLRQSRRPVFTTLSARVGSIGDNRLGGWYSYRASKAALNMLIKTLSIEWARFTPKITCAALHPGTVRTELSQPFVAGKQSDYIFSPTMSADYLLEVIDDLGPEQTGQFFAWDGRPIPW